MQSPAGSQPQRPVAGSYPRWSSCSLRPAQGRTNPNEPTSHCENSPVMIQTHGSSRMWCMCISHMHLRISVYAYNRADMFVYAYKYKIYISISLCVFFFMVYMPCNMVVCLVQLPMVLGSMRHCLVILGTFLHLLQFWSDLLPQMQSLSSTAGFIPNFQRGVVNLREKGLVIWPFGRLLDGAGAADFPLSWSAQVLHICVFVLFKHHIFIENYGGGEMPSTSALMHKCPHVNSGMCWCVEA